MLKYRIFTFLGQTNRPTDKARYGSSLPEIKKVSCIQKRSLNNKYPELVYRRLPYLFYSIETTQTRPFLSHSLLSEKRAIINVPDLLRKEFRYLFTLRNSCSTHHRGLIWFRISDRKFVNHTTEMILWSMILTWVEIFHYLVCFGLLIIQWGGADFFF